MEIYPFQEVPGLLTPEMQTNVRNQSLLSAAAGLFNAAGYSRMPRSPFEALGAGLQAGLQGYSDGQTNALRQLLMREQIAKAQDDRMQRERWQRLFGVDAAVAGPGGGAGSGAPVPTQLGQPGLLTPGAPTTPETPLTPAMPALPSLAAVNAAVPAAPGAGASPQPGAIPTQRDVRASASGGVNQVLNDMPLAVRQVIGIMGPQKGLDTLATWVGRKAEKPSDTFITVRGPDGSLRPYRADSKDLDAAIASGGIIVTTPSSDKQHKPDNYILPDGRNVLSEDGKTYTDPVTKQTTSMPPNAMRVGSDVIFESQRQAKVQSRAQSELDANAGGDSRPPAESPTLKGTGPWTQMGAAWNAVAGGMGVDKAFDVKSGFFPDTLANRQYLLNLRQVGKTALVNNPRFPVAEQKNVDRLFPDPESMWVNPRTEAAKIPILRNMLREQLATNNEAIASGALSKAELSKLTQNNIETRRTLRLLGEGDASLDVLGNKMPSTERKPAQAGNAWARVRVGDIVLQGGRKYQKQPDGSAKEVE